jgi:diaminopimelate decarboxylase
VTDRTAGPTRTARRSRRPDATLEDASELGPSGDPAASTSSAAAAAPAAPAATVAPGTFASDPARGCWREGLVAGLDPAALAATYGTPLYVYDLDMVEACGRRLRSALPARFDIAYAAKANPSLAVITAAIASGTGVDVASSGELEAALRVGASPRAIVVTGPGKSDALLRRATTIGVRAVVVESPGELERLECAAEASGSVAGVLFRLPAHAGQTFGMSWEDAVEGASRARASSRLEPLGVHAFGVSAERDPGVLAAHVERTVDAGRRLAVAAGFPLRLVDAGGGLGVPYTEGDAELDLQALGRLLAGLDEAWRAEPSTREMRVILEPGRFLAAPAGVYIARVVDVKRLHGRHVAVLDGGINHLLAPALVGRHHRLRLAGIAAHGPAGVAAPGTAGRASAQRAGVAAPAEAGTATSDGRALVPTDLVGPLCTSLDVLDRLDAFPETRPGDLVVVLDVGAYGFTQSMPWFLSHEGPAEVGVSGGRPHLLRARLDPGAMVDAQFVPSARES